MFLPVLMTLEIILIVFIIAGNTLTILAIYRFKHLRIASYVMIGALSVSDLLIGTIYMPLVLFRMYNHALFNDRILCLTMIFVGQSISMANTVFQSTLSLDRFYAVQFPYHYHSNVTVKHNLKWSIALFLGMFCINVPVLCGIDLWQIYPKCYAPTLLPKAYVRFLVVITMVFLAAGLLAFVRVLIAELNLRRKDREQELSDLEKQSHAQSTLMILVYAVSMLLALPHIVYYCWGTITNTPYDPVILGVMQLFDVCNSAVNCVIYGIKNTKFRWAYKRLLGIKGAQLEPEVINIPVTK